MKMKRTLAVLTSLIMVAVSGVGTSYADTVPSMNTAAPVPFTMTAAAANQSTASAVTTSISGSAVYSDISGHWAENIIKEAAGLKIVGGYPDGTFFPDNLIKREEFYKLLTNIMTTVPNTVNTKVSFTDVVDYEWYVPTIKIAVASGITSGYGDGKFGIGMMISRQEAAKVAGSVIPALNVDNAKGVESAKDKAQIADWAYKYVDLMFKKGYMKGDTEGNFRPTMALTRAEAATILLNIKKNESIIAANATEQATTPCMTIHTSTAGVFVKGKGTQGEPFEIATEEQLNHVRMHVSEGAFYVLTKNIAITKDYATVVQPASSDDPDWSQGNFEPIGTAKIPFKGNLDGGGYTISGLNIAGTIGKGSDKTKANYSGLFGYLGSGATVQNVIVDASTIAGNQYTGSIAGYNDGTIKNCQLGIKGIVEGLNNTGGITGFSTQPLSSLRNMGTVTGKDSNTGGIVGYINAPGTSILYCQNEGTVTGNERTGGVVGKFDSAPLTSSTIKECYNKGTVQAGPYNTGGIAGTASGKSYSITIEDCGNSGVVTSSGVNGGIAGVLEAESATISKCKNTGTVSGSGAGGIVGNNQGIVINSYNSGNITGNLDGGGIAAYQQNELGRITKCYNEGTVYSKSFAGGIIGENGSRVDNCYNSGKISGTNSIGGIAGKNTGRVANVYGCGTVTGESGSGVLLGRNAGILEKAYWLGTAGTTGVGMVDSSGAQSIAIKVTHEELSGQKKINSSNGYEMLINIMNANNTTNSDIINKTKPAPVWQYLYKILKQATSGGALVSDGGGIVTPLEEQNSDGSGNTIDPNDLTTKYLYPSITN